MCDPIANYKPDKQMMAIYAWNTSGKADVVKGGKINTLKKEQCLSGKERQNKVKFLLTA